MKQEKHSYVATKFPYQFVNEKGTSTFHLPHEQSITIPISKMRD
jgi:hypothetical protein